MKKIIGTAIALMMGVCMADAAIEIGLDSFEAGNVSNTVFTISNLEGTPTFDGGILGDLGLKASVFLGDVVGASGSLKITLSATDIAGPTEPTNWVFGVEAPLYSYGYGLGITSAGESGAFNQHGPGEVFKISFNTNNLSLTDGKALVFSLKDQNLASFTIFQRTGTSAGVEVASMVGVTPSVYTVPVRVTSSPVANGTLEFAVADLVWGIMKKLQIDVVDADPELIPPQNFGGIPRNSGALLNWDDDETGKLDHYTVYRSLVTPVTTGDWSTNVTESSYIDSGLTNGLIYYYAATASGTNGVETALSEEVAITPAALSTNAVLLMHYDASDVASVQTNLSGAVTSWLNQVGGGATYPAVSTTYPSPLYPSDDRSDSGISGLDCTTDPTQLNLMTAPQSDVLFDMSGTNSGFVVMMAIRPATLKTNLNAQYILANSSGPAAGGFGIRQKNNGIETWLGASAGTMSSIPATGATVVVSVRYDVQDLELTAWESASGNSLSVPRDPVDYSTALWLNLGDYTHLDYDFEGQIFEVKIWGSTLDDATLAAEKNTMLTKWVGSGYDRWAKGWAAEGFGSTTDDYDNDGLNNLYEYGLGGDPTNTTVAPAVLPIITNTGSGLKYVHVQRNDDPSLVYSIKTTTDLVQGIWTNLGVTAVSTNAGEGFFNTVTNSVDSGVDQRFIRLIIEN